MVQKTRSRLEIKVSSFYHGKARALSRTNGIMLRLRLVKAQPLKLDLGTGSNKWARSTPNSSTMYQPSESTRERLPDF